MKYFNQTFSYTGPIPLHVKRLKNFDFVAHWHTDIEMVLVQEGSIRIGVNHSQKQLGIGDMVVCGSGDIHSFESRGARSAITSIIFPPELLDHKAGWPKGFSFESPYIVEDICSPPLREELRTRFLSIVLEAETKDFPSPMIIKGKLLEFCGLLTRYLPHSAAASQQRFAAKNRRIREILAYVEENYMHPLSIESLSRKFDMNPFYFCKTFKAITGMTFTLHLHFIRISVAEYMLTNTSKPITEIAYDCGFNSIRSFNRVFKELKGFAPSKLR